MNVRPRRSLTTVRNRTVQSRIVRSRISRSRTIVHSRINRHRITVSRNRRHAQHRRRVLRLHRTNVCPSTVHLPRGVRSSRRLVSSLLPSRRSPINRRVAKKGDLADLVWQIGRPQFGRLFCCRCVCGMSSLLHVHLRSNATGHKRHSCSLLCPGNQEAYASRRIDWLACASL
jgi:hypothetical protein